MRSAFLAAILATGLHSQNFVGQIRMRPLLPPLTHAGSPAPAVNSLPLVDSIPRPPSTSTCAIPLLNVRPRNANPDPGMIIRPSGASPMREVVPPAPPCQP